MENNTGIEAGENLLQQNKYVTINEAAQRIGKIQKKMPTAPAAAFHGLAGIIKLIEKETEADSMALLLSLLVGYGNCIGRNAYYEVAAAKHYTNLFAVMVGESSKARKGTSWNVIKNIFKSYAQAWISNNTKSGLSSGEGLKYNVRDAARAINEDGEEYISDVGIADKRLLIFESEFASALKVANRTGSTLSTTIRDAWDTGYLSTLTKNDAIVATNAHISILGHITVPELLKNLSETEAAGYFTQTDHPFSLQIDHPKQTWI